MWMAAKHKSLRSLPTTASAKKRTPPPGEKEKKGKKRTNEIQGDGKEPREQKLSKR